MMSREPPSRLLFPALRADGRALPLDPDDPGVRGVLERGPGGFIVFGGGAERVRGLTARLQRDAPEPLLFGADLERGAGQQFDGATALPPLAALGSLDDLGVLWRAGELTAREAAALGIRWIYAPVADLANEPDNPIVGTRSLGADPEAVARGVTAWVLGCLAGGGIPCVKHFPGHGRTTTDSHLETPVVSASLSSLALDLVPFAAAVEAGVPSVMTAHVGYPAYDASGAPATRSAPILRGLLRERLGFERVVVSDALVMEGARAGGGPGSSSDDPDDTPGSVAVAAVRAGVDALLYPRDVAGAARALSDAVEVGRLGCGEVERARARVEALIRRAGGAPVDASDEPVGRDEDRRWADGLADRALRVVREPPSLRGGPVSVVTVDDDAGGPFDPPDRTVLARTLSGEGLTVRIGEGPGSGDGADLVAVFAEARGWKGRAGLSEASEAAVRRALSRSAHPLLLLFGHPRLAATLPPDVPVLLAWGGEAPMQRAAARRVARMLG